ncbi:MAG: hypothetical protein ACPG4Z_05825 [Chitinophagales bacterium]
MEVKDYTNERLKNTINQHYSFPPQIVKEAITEVKKRGLMSSLEIEKAIEAGNLKYQQNQIENRERVNKRYGTSSKFAKFADKFFLIAPILGLFAGFILWLKTGNVFFFAIFPASAGGLIARRQFRK